MATKEMGGGGDATVIGPSILVNGKLTGDEDLTVRGRVEGELTLSRTLIVEMSGVVKADVSVRNAIVSGVVVGNITATESVELTKEGRMVGDIRAPRVIIVDGASFRGRVDMGNAEPSAQPRTERPRAVSTPSRPAMRPATTPPRPPPPPSKVEPRKTEAAAKPTPPPPPKAAETKPPPPLPPNVAAAAAGGKKKVIVRKKGK